MTKAIILLLLATGYVMGLHALTDRALSLEQNLAHFYTSPTNPLTDIPASAQVADGYH